MLTVYTIGHSNHPMSYLIQLLKQHQIALIADIRRYPHSRYNPQFNKPQLELELKLNGIDYRFMGDKLGGKEDFEKIIVRPEFTEGIKEIMAMVAKGIRLALLCAEEDPQHCHRQLLLEPIFDKSGVRLIHIRGDGRLEEKEKSLQLELF